MEIAELRYFVCAARHENLQKAAKELHISAGSISKAISKLEDDYGVKLFGRVGRALVLNEHGRILQRKASKILQLVEDSRGEITGHAASLQVTIVGLEVFVAHFAPPIVAKLCKKNPNLVVRLECEQSEEKAALKVQRGEAQLAITTLDPSPDLLFNLLGQTTFKTCVGPGHRLYEETSNKPLPVQDVMNQSFVCPEGSLLGRVEGKMSADGWRDDKYPRKVSFVANNFKLLECIVQSGLAMAYLPDFYVQQANLKVINVGDCPYSCKQKIHLVGSAELLPYTLGSLFSEKA